MLEKIKNNISLIFVVVLTFLCGTFDYYIEYSSWFCLFLIWHLSPIVIFICHKNKIRSGIEYMRKNATDAEIFVGICHIGFCFVWIFIIAAMTFIYPLDLCAWWALETTYETFAEHIFWYSLTCLLFGFGLLFFFSFFCSLMTLPFTLIGRSVFNDNHAIEKFPNIWLDHCALPIALFAYITQLTGAADLYGAFNQILEYLS